jgi:hypothetical protein
MLLIIFDARLTIIIGIILYQVYFFKVHFVTSANTNSKQLFLFLCGVQIGLFQSDHGFDRHVR